MAAAGAKPGNPAGRSGQPGWWHAADMVWRRCMLCLAPRLPGLPPGRYGRWLLPRRVDLSNAPYMPPVLDQGSLSTCTAHAAANAYRFAFVKEARQQQAFMPRWEHLMVWCGPGGGSTNALFAFSGRGRGRRSAARLPGRCDAQAHAHTQSHVRCASKRAHMPEAWQAQPDMWSQRFNVVTSADRYVLTHHDAALCFLSIPQPLVYLLQRKALHKR